MQRKKLFAFIIFALVLDCDVFAQAPAQEDFPFVMYVTARAGLRVRRAASPSLDSEIDRTLPYGYFMYVFERQDNPVTINGIADYWYRISSFSLNNTFEWVFGGYLSRELPEDLPVVFGWWHVLEYDEEYHPRNRSILFTHDYQFYLGWAGLDGGIRGTWSINENTITLRGSTFEHGIDYEDLGEFHIYFQIIDRNNISFRSYEQGELLYFEHERLTRSGRR